MNRITLLASVFSLLSCSEGDTVNNYYITPESSSGTAGSSSSLGSSSSSNASSSSSTQTVSSSGYSSGSLPASSSGESGTSSSGISVGVSSSSAISIQSSSSIQTGIISGEPVIYMGETYETVVIGTQTWMARNLNYNVNSSRCYENKPENCQKYGRLYSWFTANEICPPDYHLPTKEEWEVLTTFVGGSAVLGSYRAGKKLKAKSDWKDNGNGTDDYGFTALPGGYGIQNNTYDDINEYGYWWSATPYSDNYAELICINYSEDYAKFCNFGNDGDKGRVYSVRCVKD